MATISSCSYWFGDFLKIHHLFFKSFLKTQPIHFILDVYIENCHNASVFMKEYTKEEMARINIINLNWKNIAIPNLVSHDFGFLKRKNLALLSDYFRFFTMIKYDKYKFYFDMDICFIRSFEELLTHKAFVYTWGNFKCGNSAVFMKDANTPRELINLLYINRTPHPNIFRPNNKYIDVKPCGPFNPQWLTNEFELPFDDTFLSKFKMDDLIKKHDCYCVHWHNHWKVDPETVPKSWIGSKYSFFVTNIDMNL